jgi:hypothetical protein
VSQLSDSFSDHLPTLFVIGSAKVSNFSDFPNFKKKKFRVAFSLFRWSKRFRLKRGAKVRKTFDFQNLFRLFIFEADFGFPGAGGG